MMGVSSNVFIAILSLSNSDLHLKINCQKKLEWLLVTTIMIENNVLYIR